MTTVKSRVAQATKKEFHVWRLAVPLMLLYAFIISPLAREISSTRWWRDVSGQTPFYSVKVTVQDITPEGLRLMGYFVKRRCEFRGLTAYVRVDGIKHRARVDTSKEDGGRPYSRPPASGLQAFGPLEILWPMTRPKPDQWSIWARHMCPGETITQTNLFAKGLWQ